MDGGHASLSFDDGASGADSPQRPLDGKGGETPDAEEPGSPRSDAVFASRDVSEASEKEEEESEGPLRVQDLKEAHLQLVQGVQEWQDGCVYRGEFGLNMKLGYGEFSWPTGESYHGEFYRDHCHGLGTYMWPDGSSFTGTFYLSRREGYGTMRVKTRLFQGLYKADQRFGPGVETYPDGSQDVGLWFRGHLIKLCTQSPGGFSLLGYPEFSSVLSHSPARISLSDEEETEWGPQEGQDPFSYEYKRLLLHDDLTLPPEMYVYSTDSEHLPGTSSFRRELDARLFLSDIPPFVEDEEPWLITNETPLLVKIQKQTYKFRNKPAHTSWNMGAILEGKRSGFALCGPKEQLAMEMIVNAEEGNHGWIYGVLKDDLASADVADAKGYTVLAAAATHCHDHIVNLLLDCGADVNKRSDEGLTPLSMCFLLYYPAQSFKPNIAERTVPKPQLGTLTPLHIAAALPGEEGVRIVELLLHAITDVDARAADKDDTYQPGQVDLLPSSLKLSNEPGPPRAYYGTHTPLPEEGGRTALHVACEREDNYECARDIIRLLLSHRANPNLLWSGHSPLSLSIASGNDLVVTELLTQGADPNLSLTKGLGSALCVACDLTYEHQRSMDSKLALIDQLISHGADILKPVTLRQGEKVAVGTAVDYGYFKFFQDRKIAHCPFHTLMPAERETFVARKRLLEYMGLRLRKAVFAKESQWDPTWLYLCKRAELIPSHRMKKRDPSLPKGLDVKGREQIPFFKFCCLCGRSIGVHLLPCPRCYGVLTCSKYCRTKAWTEFHKKDCGDMVAIGAHLEEVSRRREESQ
uniref:ankyrin repeat and MYND domain-containing protein 1 isoform X10 n=1 Tax=Callithrix jacchus TaxID=9483 RepID=UPI0023DCF4E5|nr:ankyrin repeat and MYND domain-containing protein 1 isoform X10 [Callithrix jacchus]